MLSFNKHVFFSALAVVLLATLVCFRFFGDIILHPDEFLFGPNGDGLKNYFSVAYQVIHGEGFQFNGMLYPYGDHLIFADGQPLLTKVLSWFIEPDVKNGPQVIGIMNLLMIGSLVVTCWCVHRLLVWNYVNPWFAVPFALTIGFLSPQLARFTGHYALGYTFFVPMCWLLVASISKYKQAWLMVLLTSIFILGAAFIHPYYLFIFLVFLGSIIGWEIIINKFRFSQIENLAAKLSALILPLIAFVLYQKLVNPYTDRPQSPSGIFSHMATFQSVFVPVQDPFYSLFNSYFFRIFIPSSWEGHAYIGMVGSFTAFVSVAALIKRTAKRKWKTFTHPVLPNALKTAFIPAILSLLFAMGLFHQLGLYWLSDYIAQLKQFRSLGRLAWIFYYVFSVWVAYHLYVIWRHFRSVNSGQYVYHITAIICVCAFLWMLDAIVNIKSNKANMLTRNDTESFSDHYASLWENAEVKISEHQAIIPLPLVLVGSEKIGLEKGKASLAHAMKGSFSSGLPIVGGAMSRTSYSTTEKTAQLVANQLIPRTITADLNPDKNLLMLWSFEALTKDESRLANAGQIVYQNNEYRLYSVSVSELEKTCRKPEADSLNITESPSYLTPKTGELSEHTLWGANTFLVADSHAILDTVFPTSQTLLISYWLKVIQTEEVFPDKAFYVDDTKVFGGQVGTSPNLLDGWLMINDTLKTEAGKRHKYVMKSRTGTVGRIQLRDANSNLAHEEDSLVFVNNIPLR